eukprot:763409-Hanusia_phi.AAC.7
MKPPSGTTLPLRAVTTHHTKLKRFVRSGRPQPGHSYPSGDFAESMGGPILTAATYNPQFHPPHPSCKVIGPSPPPHLSNTRGSCHKISFYMFRPLMTTYPCPSTIYLILPPVHPTPPRWHMLLITP